MAHADAASSDAIRPLTRLGVSRSAVTGRSLRRAWPSLLAGSVAAALLVALAWDAGGYFPSAHLRAGSAAFAVLAVVIAVRPPHYSLSAPALLALAALAGLTLWTGLSSHWSSAPDTALEDMQRDLCLLGLFGLGLVAAGSGRHASQLVRLVLAVAVAITAGGLLSRLYPDLAGATAGTFDADRLAYPLSYWNAFGTLAALTVVLAAGLAADPRSPALLRAVCAAAVAPAGVAGYLSFSRGAWLALAAGLVVLTALSPHRGQLAATVAVCGGALALAVLALDPALTDPAPLAERAQAGRAYAPLLAVLAVAAGAVQYALAKLPPARLPRALALAPAAAALLAATAAFALAGDRADGFVARQWDEFMHPATFSASGSERLTTASGTRSDLYRVAIDGFQAHPLTGDGGGGFEVRYAHDRDVTEKVRDAHSLYFETLGELGLPGLALLAAFLGAVVWAALVASARPGALPRAQASAVAAAFSVWAVHAGLDWDWQVPALTGLALVLAAALFPVGRKRRRPNRRVSGRISVERVS